MYYERLKNGKIKKGDIANKANVSQPYFSQILNGDRKPSWETAKKLYAVTGIPVELWMESKNNPEQLRTKLKELKK